MNKFAKEDYCYLTTRGRRTGKAHEIEIWFGVYANSLYLLSGGGQESDWVKNLQMQPSVQVRLAGETYAATARLVHDAAEQLLARQLLSAKYYHWETGAPLDEWAATALPVALDIVSATF
ncbi:MAG TPA: nitroreductase family deazaflavin-dependent oxidoreductase [Anaerolineales bacterium]|nr:nitroreductase family deazaflavin-dependent oxidoreductase [Anaerolineales bacterium]